MVCPGSCLATPPVRSRAGWEQAASLRLRAREAQPAPDPGESGAELEAAVAAYVALTLDGTDTLLMAADHALRRERSRRIRGDLICLGVVQAGLTVRIANGDD